MGVDLGPARPSLEWQHVRRLNRRGPFLVDRVVRSEPARGPLQLHHLDGKTETACLRCGNRSQTRIVATVDGDWRRLIDRGCYDVWIGQLDA
jgi:hypothetical protein